MLERIPATHAARIFAARPLLASLAAALAPRRAAAPRAASHVVLRLVRAGAGHASAPGTVALDFSAPARWPDSAALGAVLHQQQQQQATLHALAAAGLAVPPADETALLELGRSVAALLAPATRAALQAAIARARGEARALLLHIVAAPDASAALGIPWELLVLPLGWGDTADDFALLQADIGMARQIRGLGRAPDQALAQPLRAAGFAAAPCEGPPIAAAGAPDRAHWHRGPATLAELHARLSAEHPQLVQLLCHGEISDTGHARRSCLLLADSAGRTQRVAAHELARVLAASQRLQIVLLQACHGGTLTSGPGAAASSVALTLLRYGVPAVVAMQGEVGQASADTFARMCCAALAGAHPIAQAVAAGRMAMRAAGHADWALPVLYTGTQPSRRHAAPRLAGGV